MFVQKTKHGTTRMLPHQAYAGYGEKILADGSYVPLTEYTGHVQADPTGLIYMRGRFYSPAWHVFVNSDQGVDPLSWNQRAYVGGNPFMAIDPTGLMANTICQDGQAFSQGSEGVYVPLVYNGQMLTCSEAAMHGYFDSGDTGGGNPGGGGGNGGGPTGGGAGGGTGGGSGGDRGGGEDKGPATPKPQPQTPTKPNPCGNIKWTSNLTVGVGAEWEAGFGKTDTHGFVAITGSLTNSGNGMLPDGLSGQVVVSTPAPATAFGAAFSVGKNITVGNAGGASDFNGVTHNRSLTLGIIQFTYGYSDSGVKQFSIGGAIGLSFSKYDTVTGSAGVGADCSH